MIAGGVESMTRVPLSAPEIAGVLNLRGRIVTAVAVPLNLAITVSVGALVGSAATAVAVTSLIEADKAAAQIVKPDDPETFHDQVGYWLWEPATGMIMQTIAIPRGQVVLAGGKASPDDKRISVEARRGDTRFVEGRTNVRIP